MRCHGNNDALAHLSLLDSVGELDGMRQIGQTDNGRLPLARILRRERKKSERGKEREKGL